MTSRTWQDSLAPQNDTLCNRLEMSELQKSLIMRLSDIQENAAICVPLIFSLIAPCNRYYSNFKSPQLLGSSFNSNTASSTIPAAWLLQ